MSLPGNNQHEDMEINATANKKWKNNVTAHKQLAVGMNIWKLW